MRVYPDFPGFNPEIFWDNPLFRWCYHLDTEEHYEAAIAQDLVSFRICIEVESQADYLRVHQENEGLPVTEFARRGRTIMDGVPHNTFPTLIGVVGLTLACVLGMALPSW